MLFLPLTGMPINSVHIPKPTLNPLHHQASSHCKQSGAVLPLSRDTSESLLRLCLLLHLSHSP